MPSRRQARLDMCKESKAAYAGLNGGELYQSGAQIVRICRSLNILHGSTTAYRPCKLSKQHSHCICRANTQNMQYAGSCNIQG
jgi:hypothetical protein